VWFVYRGLLNQKVMKSYTVFKEVRKFTEFFQGPIKAKCLICNSKCVYPPPPPHPLVKKNLMGIIVLVSGIQYIELLSPR
jgi:hypothetical protein